MDSFEKIFCGTWKWDRDENLEEAMRKMGTPEGEIKMYSSLKPTITFERRGDSVCMIFEMMKGMSDEHIFKFGEEFDAKDHRMDPPAYYNKETATLKDGVMAWVSRNQLKGPGKVDTYSEYFVKGDELHTPMSLLDDRSYSGNRIYKRYNGE